MGLMNYLQQKGKQVVGLVLTATFLSTIFAYGTGGYRAIREECLFFTPAMISTHLESYNEEEKAEIEKDLEVVRSICFSTEEVETRIELYCVDPLRRSFCKTRQCRLWNNFDRWSYSSIFEKSPRCRIRHHPASLLMR